jgi:hypothetical protein
MVATEKLLKPLGDCAAESLAASYEQAISVVPNVAIRKKAECSDGIGLSNR